MPTLLLNISDNVAIHAMTAASAKAMSLDDYVEWCLSLQNTQANKDLLVNQGPQNIENLAAQLFKKALVPSIFTPDDAYQVEAIYKQSGFPKKWEDLDRGFRIMVGKAFKREVEAQSDDSNVKVVFVGRTQQNQTLYKTIKVG